MLIFFVVLYWLRIKLFLLDHGSNVSVIAVALSLRASFFVEDMAAASARDRGSISACEVFTERGSTTGDDVTAGACLFTWNVMRERHGETVPVDFDDTYSNNDA